MIKETAISACLLQVYDLQEYRPAPVLKKIWKNFEAQERNGDTWAPIVRGWVQPFVPLPGCLPASYKTQGSFHGKSTHQ